MKILSGRLETKFSEPILRSHGRLKWGAYSCLHKDSDFAHCSRNGLIKGFMESQYGRKCVDISKRPVIVTHSKRLFVEGLEWLVHCRVSCWVREEDKIFVDFISLNSGPGAQTSRVTDKWSYFLLINFSIRFLSLSLLLSFKFNPSEFKYYVNLKIIPYIFIPIYLSSTTLAY